MTGNIVARRYAKALFALAKKAGKKAPAEYGKDLEAFASVLEGSPDLLKVFANPIISADVKKSVLSGVAGKLGLKPHVLPQGAAPVSRIFQRYKERAKREGVRPGLLSTTPAARREPPGSPTRPPSPPC